MTGWNMPPGCNPRDIPGWDTPDDPVCALCGQPIDAESEETLCDDCIRETAVEQARDNRDGR